MRYQKAPILQAVLEFRWASEVPLEVLKKALGLSVFTNFEEPKPRYIINASLDVRDADQSVKMEQERQHVGFEISLRDGSEAVILEQDKFVFIQSAPYNCWQYYSNCALSLVAPVAELFGLAEFSRLGLRFVNRIDVPFDATGNFNTDDYITVKFDGPRTDVGVIEEFQMRVVKPTSRDGIAYALTVATAQSPLTNHGGILLDIDVFTRQPVHIEGSNLLSILSTMRAEKNDIFEKCITKQSRALFGGTK